MKALQNNCIKKIEKAEGKGFSKKRRIESGYKKMNKKKLEMKERIFPEVQKIQLRALQNIQMEKQV
jgi:hypothetical protein